VGAGGKVQCQSWWHRTHAAPIPPTKTWIAQEPGQPLLSWLYRRVALVQRNILALCFEMAAAIDGPVEPFPRASERKKIYGNFLFGKCIINADTYPFLIRNQKSGQILRGKPSWGSSPEGQPELMQNNKKWKEGTNPLHHGNMSLTHLGPCKCLLGVRWVDHMSVQSHVQKSGISRHLLQFQTQ